MKALLALALLAVTGCSSTCKDGSGGFLRWDHAYRACGKECCRNEKECGCSAQCPCWKEKEAK